MTEAADFLHTAVFTAGLDRSCAGLCLHPGAGALGAPRLVSTPSHDWAWLGIASTHWPGVLPNLRGFTQGLSPSGAQFSKSAVSTYSTTRANQRYSSLLCHRGFQPNPSGIAHESVGRCYGKFCGDLETRGISLGDSGMMIANHAVG